MTAERTVVLRQATSADVGAIGAIAAALHAALPERAAVLEEKIALFGPGCCVFADGPQVLGYGLSHPWLRDDAPALDTFLHTLPERPTSLFIHDVALLPPARGAGLVGAYVARLEAIAARLDVAELALVSVYGTGRLWERHGFRDRAVERLAAKLAAYGEEAVYMTKPRMQRACAAEKIS